MIQASDYLFSIFKFVLLLLSLDCIGIYDI